MSTAEQYITSVVVRDNQDDIIERVRHKAEAFVNTGALADIISSHLYTVNCASSLQDNTVNPVSEQREMEVLQKHAKTPYKDIYEFGCESPKPQLAPGHAWHLDEHTKRFVQRPLQVSRVPYVCKECGRFYLLSNGNHRLSIDEKDDDGYDTVDEYGNHVSLCQYVSVFNEGDHCNGELREITDSAELNKRILNEMASDAENFNE